MGIRDPRVDEYIARSAGFAQPILLHLRKVIHAASPEIDEAIKWGFPHFMYKGILCSMASFKEHCALGFYREDALRPSGLSRIEDGMGQFGRITSIGDLPSPAVLKDCVREAMRLNEPGVAPPRKAAKKRAQELEIPESLVAALRDNPEAQSAFERFSPSQKKEYAEWIADAKRAETRDRRIATAIDWIAEGKPRNWKYMKR